MLWGERVILDNLVPPQPSAKMASSPKHSITARAGLLGIIEGAYFDDNVGARPSANGEWVLNPAAWVSVSASPWGRLALAWRAPVPPQEQAVRQ